MSHEHGPHPLDAAFRWAVILNTAYVVLEAVAGFVTGSLALLADAAHNLTDVGGLLIAWGAAVLAQRGGSARFTYGLGRGTILAALANAIAILVGVGAVVWEAVRRLGEPVDVAAGTVLAVATLGIAVNAGTALLFRKQRAHDLNAAGAFLHMLADAAVSLAVVVAAAVVLATGWAWVDPLAAIAVSLVITIAAYDLFRRALRLSLDGVPEDIDRAAVRAWLLARPGVRDVHDLHIWALSTTRTALTAHLVMPDGHPGDAFLDEVAAELGEHFAIAHATLQIELGNGPTCRLDRAAA